MDIALKQRLVGAIVLIALAVVVLPMFLGGRPQQDAREAQPIELPPQPKELQFQTRRYPIGSIEQAGQESEQGEQAGVAQEALPQPSQAPQPEASPGQVTAVEVEPREFRDALAAGSPVIDESSAASTAAADLTPTEPPAAQPAASDVAAAGSLTDRYVVQVASFGSVANADRLAERLRNSGHNVLSDTVSSDVGTLHRIRTGPYPSEAEAAAAAGRIRQQIGEVKPRIVDLQPDSAAQVTAPSDPLVRWVVQLGSFSSVANADRLVERVRAEGLSGYREAVTGSGSTIYRVRVGPFIERDEAIRVDALVAERLSVDGVVMSTD